MAPPPRPRASIPVSLIAGIALLSVLTGYLVGSSGGGTLATVASAILAVVVGTIGWLRDAGWLSEYRGAVEDSLRAIDETESSVETAMSRSSATIKTAAIGDGSIAADDEEPDSRGAPDHLLQYYREKIADLNDKVANMSRTLIAVNEDYASLSVMLTRTKDELGAALGKLNDRARAEALSLASAERLGVALIVVSLGFLAGLVIGTLYTLNDLRPPLTSSLSSQFTDGVPVAPKTAAELTAWLELDLLLQERGVAADRVASLYQRIYGQPAQGPREPTLASSQPTGVAAAQWILIENWLMTLGFTREFVEDFYGRNTGVDPGAIVELILPPSTAGDE